MEIIKMRKVVVVVVCRRLSSVVRRRPSSSVVVRRPSQFVARRRSKKVKSCRSMIIYYIYIYIYENNKNIYLPKGVSRRNKQNSEPFFQLFAFCSQLFTCCSFQNVSKLIFKTVSNFQQREFYRHSNTYISRAVANTSIKYIIKYCYQIMNKANVPKLLANMKYGSV